MRTLEDVIVDAIKIIENDGIKYHIYPYPKTISSFIRGIENSPFFDKFYKHYPSVCGFDDFAYPNIVKEKMDDLCKEHKLCKGQFYSTKIAYSTDVEKRFLSNLDYCEELKEYSEKYFLNMADWDKNPGGAVKYKVKCNDGYIYKCNSKQERDVVSKLNKYPFIKHIRGQKLGIEYEFGNTTHTYYPDVVLYTISKHIIIIEVKQLYDLGVIDVMVKMINARAYAKKHKFAYSSFNVSFNGYLYLLNYNYSKKLEKDILDNISKYGQYTYEDFNSFTSGRKTALKKTDRISLAAIVFRNNLYMDDNFFGKRQFVIKDL